VRLVLVGPPGAGKGTQAEFIADHFAIPKISTGDIFRANVSGGSDLGKLAKKYMDAGDLVPDEVTVAMVRERLAEDDAKVGFLLDGFPRTIGQAEALTQILKELGQELDAVVYFDVPEAELLRRLTGRRVCRQCGSTFHMVSAPPAKPGVCDRCGGPLYQREDDSEATVANRLRVYERQTAPLLDYYRDRGLLRSVRGDGTMAAVGAAIRQAVGQA
jgi:adenylate kinase